MSPKSNARPVKFIGAVEDEWQLYSDNPSDYTLGRPIGHGASSIVYQAEYHNSKESIPCALKVLDLDSLPVSSLRLLQRETQLMSLSKHPNVLRVRGTWMEGHKLFIALRLMRSGSVTDVMRYAWPGGVEEEVARCVLKQALEGLNYLHINGFIHRDIKAANLLIDDDGTVLLGDLGVAASLNDEDSVSTRNVVVGSIAEVIPQRPPAMRSKAGLGKRKSFVGTPCWMAPEVISQKQYDSKADIWSLGITALELAQGRAPRSREPPYKVLMKTLQDDPPTLDREGGQFKYSKSFKEMIESCLMKDPNRRPTAEELLQTSFFKATKKKSYLVGALLRDLPPLVDRQERRRTPSALTPLSMESWDFSKSLIPITSVSMSLNRLSEPDEDLFEMEVGEAAELPKEDKEDTHVVFSTPSGHPLRDTAEAVEKDDSFALTDDAVSTSSGSPLSSSVATSLAGSNTLNPEPQPSSRSSPSSISSSTSRGLWRKLHGKGLMTSEKGIQHYEQMEFSEDGLNTVVDKYKGDDVTGMFLQRSPDKSGTTVSPRLFR